MTLNTFVAGNSGSVRQLASSMRNLGAGVEDAATGLHRARSDSEADWEGQAGDAFRAAADSNARDADRLAQLHTDLGSALTGFADDLDTVNARMEQARQVATAAKLRVQGIMIFAPDATTSAKTAPGSPLGAPPDQKATAALYAQQAAYQEAEATVNQARDMERTAHQKLQDALKANSSDLDGLGQHNAWMQAAAAPTLPAAAALAKAATAMDDWAANATKAAFEQAISGGPAAVHGAWMSMTPDQQADLKARFPQMVGSTDGVPTVDRDQANRSILAAQRQALANKVAQLRAQWQARTSSGRGNEFPEESSQLQEAEQSLAGLDRLQQVLGPPGSGHYLIALDSTANDGRGQTIVASGDPDTADNVATLVPGTFHDLHDAADYVQRNDQMLQQANAYAPDKHNAAIMYGNYQAPPSLPNAAGGVYAQHGENGLANYQESLRVTHAPNTPPSNNTVIGHSYGSTLVGYAARDHGGMNANNLVFVGSPGVGVDHANQLGVPPDHVWVGTAQNDVIRDVPSPNPVDWFTGDDHTRYGLEPYDPGFGANTLPTDPTAGHSDYWSRPQSLDGMAKVMVGQTPGEGTPHAL